MHRDDVVDVEIDQFLEGLAEIVLFVRRQMETSKDRVDFLHARRRYRLLHRVYHTAVPAGRHDHQPASLDIDAGRNLVVELVRSPIDGAAVRRHFVGEAAETIVDSDFHPGWR